MIYEIITQWKKHFLGTTFLFFGYLIGILFLSLGISIIKESKENSLISTYGNPNHNYILSIDTSEKSILTYNNILPILEKISQNSEIQILNIDNIEVDNETNLSATLVPLIYHQKPEWFPPILHGRYLTSYETLSSDNKVVIGKEIFNKVCKNGLTKESSITISGKTYNIIGVIGKENRATQFDYVIYTPLKAIPEDIKNNIANKDSKNASSNTQISLNNESESASSKQVDSINILMRKNGSAPIEDSNKLKSEFDKINPGASLNYTKGVLPEGNTEQFTNSIILTSIISGAILMVTLINVMNLSVFWILSRQREIVIKKVLGAVDRVIIKPIIFESVFVAVIATFIAILLHFIILTLLKSKLNGLGMSFNISWLNFLIALIVSIFCGIITAVPSIKIALNMNPVETLKNE